LKFPSLHYGVAAAAFVFSCAIPIRVLAQGNGRGTDSAQEAAIKAAQAKPTPRLASGHPDLNGYWNYPALTPKSAHVDADGNFFINVPNPNSGQRAETSEKPAAPRGITNPPSYKPELLDKVRELASGEINNDPAFHCIPDGVPRLGPPRQIVQAAKVLVLMYQVDGGPGDQNDFRLVPTDGRPHRTDVDPSYDGDSVGHWEGDTLVIDVNQLTDQTWLAGEGAEGYRGLGLGQGGSGYFHSDETHVVERLTRKGNALRWEATVEDPKVLAKPWVMTPQMQVLTNDMIYQQPVCEEREIQHITNKY
jgi:hypothetical protein